jgi:hypothetical protein
VTLLIAYLLMYYVIGVENDLAYVGVFILWLMHLATKGSRDG